MTRSTLSRAALGAVVLAALAVPAGAGDLKAVPRTIAKQPAYAGTPSYCLLAFGAKAEPRVWLVLDGDTLYVDRNGNGDLTEANEKVVPADPAEVEENETCKVSSLRFDVGEIPAPAGMGPYEGLELSRTVVAAKPGAPAGFKSGTMLALTVLLEQACSQSASPTFAAKPEDAPVVHLDGPLAVGPAPTPGGEAIVLYTGEDEQEITLQIGTAGLGAGSWAAMGYERVPEDAHPLLEIAFPPAKAGDPPVQAKFTLDDRC